MKIKCVDKIGLLFQIAFFIVMILSLFAPESLVRGISFGFAFTFLIKLIVEEKIWRIK